MHDTSTTTSSTPAGPTATAGARRPIIDLQRRRRQGRPRSRSRMRSWSTPVVATIAVLALAGCGGSDAASTEATSDGAGSGAAAAGEGMQEYQDCLAENGVELPEMGAGGTPGGAPPGAEAPTGETPSEEAPSGQQPPEIDADAFAAAQEACGDLAPEGMGAGGPGGPGGAGSEEMQAYTECLTENGVELPERTAPGDGDSGGAAVPPAGGPGGLGELDESDPGVAACADLRPDLPSPPDDDAATDQN